MLVVIGAGMAGLAAARTLREAGREAVVLEARDRVGGRVRTSESLGAPVDLGASWIHGVRGNPMSELADRAQVRRVATPHERAGAFDGSGWLTRRRVARVQRDFAQLLADAGRRARRADGADRSLRESIDGIVPADLEAAGRAELAMQERFLSLMMGADLDDLSARWWDQDQELPGGDELLVEGYEPIARMLSAGLDVRLGHAVDRVEVDRLEMDRGVTVSGAFGALRADAVVVTLPLGVLRAGAVRFEPGLPAEKRAALERVHMGLLDKVVLRFPERRWPRGYTYFGHLFPEGEEPWGFLDLAELGWPPILVAFVAGRHAEALERRGDSEVVEIALRGLARILGERPPAPTGAIVTRWRADPFALGSYSHLSPGATLDDYDTLGAPVGDVLYFAGEHTHRRYPATAHGAYLSGVRAAEQLLERRRSG
jgi:monoamine oxidase